MTVSFIPVFPVWVGLHEVTRSVLLGISVVLLARWVMNQGEKKKQKNYRLPPKVKEGWPLLGYWPLLGPEPHEDFFKLRDKYGSVYRVRVGNEEVVVLNDFESSREMQMKDAFLGRPDKIPLQLYREDRSFIDSNSQEWRDHRRYSLTILRDLGFGRSRMEEFIQEELRDFVTEMVKTGGKPVAALRTMTLTFTNVILILLTGKRYEAEYLIANLLPDYFRQALKNLAQTTILVYPRIQKLLYDIRFFTHRKLHNLLDLLYVFIKKEIKEHAETLDNHHMRDYMDGYLSKAGGKAPTFDIPSLRANTQLLFAAGVDTLTAIFEWTFLMMDRFPEVMRKVQKELDEVIGRERQICWEDRKDLPYTQAVLQEIQRWRTLIPLGVLRKALYDDTIQGYDIPQGTTIMSSLWAVHMDPNYWKDPEVFRPERYLSPDGTVYTKPDHVIPFSIGKRNCAGETLGLVCLFMYFATILQHFDIKVPNGDKHDLKGNLAIIHYPTPSDVVFLPRS